MSLDLSRIRIVLVEPRVPENIGMAARAMKNCGLSRLALVGAVDHLTPSACRPAMEALPILEAAEIFSDLPSAVARSRMVVGTTRRGGQDRGPLHTPAEWIRDLLPRAAGQEVSILFGTEKDGLTREAVEKLGRVKPLSLGQASRISGITPATVVTSAGGRAVR